MKNNKCFVVTIFGMIAVCAQCLFIGCASSSLGYISIAPDELTANNEALLLVSHGRSVSFGANDGVFGKINGTTINKGGTHCLLTVDNTSNEVMFIVASGNRGLIGSGNKCVRAIIDYQFTAGETYLLKIHESTVSIVGAVAFGALIPASFEYTLYSGTKDDNNNILQNGKMQELRPRAINSTSIAVLYFEDTGKEQRESLVARKSGGLRHF